jgi:NAD(P)H-flavin reductase/ferredoxin
MTFQIAVADTDYRFPCESNESVLDAAQRAGLEIPFSCRKGVCGTCKGRVVSGEARAFAGDALSPAERAEGQALFCNTRPRSDLTIAPRSIGKADPFARKTTTARVFRLQRLADDVMLVHLRFPAGIRVRFRAGQHLNLLLDNGERRDFSMANPPRESDGAQLHIRHVPGGAFTTHVFEKLRRGDVLNVEIPFGDFLLRDSAKPILFVAGSTGFAPIKSIIEDMAIKGIDREMVLYWGARALPDLYLPDLPGQWQSAHRNFTFIPVLSDPRQEDAWPGRTGFVHEAVVRDFPDLSGYQVYACGGPLMIDAARRDFVERCGLPAHEFYADSFTYAAETEARS